MKPVVHSRRVGRFAPTPSGPLHFGSLVCAVASWLDVRSVDGCWFLRIDDLDALRERPGARDAILKTLDAYALAWDSIEADAPVLHQRDRSAAYEAAAATLRRAGLTYGCDCTRAQRATSGATIHDGTCRDRDLGDGPGIALRVRIPDESIAFHDRWQGPIEGRPAREVGDLVLRRRDGLWSYPLATVVDDARLGVTDVVRGADLLRNTLAQIWLQRTLQLRPSTWMHVPLVQGRDARKLSKSERAAPLPDDSERIRIATLAAALQLLGIDTSRTRDFDGCESLLAWAATQWRTPAAHAAHAEPTFTRLTAL